MRWMDTMLSHPHSHATDKNNRGGGTLELGTSFGGWASLLAPLRIQHQPAPSQKSVGGTLRDFAVLKGLTMRIFTIHTPRKLPKYKNYKVDTIEKPVIVLIRLKNHHHQREF